MTVDTEVSTLRATSIVAGVPINCNFPLSDETWVTVRYGADVVAVLNTQYTVALAVDFQSFTVTPSAGLATVSGGVISISREPPFVQDFDLLTREKIGSSAMESALDYLTFLTQHVRDMHANSLSFPTTDPASARSSLPTAATRASKYFAFDADGKPWAATLASDIVGVNQWVIDNIFPISSKAGFNTLTGMPSTVETFGAVGDGTTDDSDAFALAIAADIPLLLDGGKTYAIKDLVVPAGSGCRSMASTGGNAVVVPAAGSDLNTVLIRIENDNFILDGVTFILPISTVDGVRPACDRAVYFLNADECTLTNCTFVGGRFGPYFGGVCKYFICSDNRCTQQYGAAISADSPDSFYIVDNILHVGGYSTADSSAAIRIGGIVSQAAVIQNGIISRNIIRGWNPSLNQEAIDLSCQAVRNLMVTENVMDACGGGGIELKTGPSALSPDIYQNVLIANNVVRLKTTGGLGIDLHISVAVAPSKESKITVVGNRIWSDNVPATATPLYGIYVTSLEDVFIGSNDVHNVNYGITLTYDVSTTGVNARTTVIGNNVRATDVALNLSSGSATVDDLVVIANRLTTTFGDAISATAPTINRATIQHNHIEAAGEGMEIRGFNASKILGNTIKSTGACILTQTTPVSDDVEIIGNHLTSATNACDIGAGTNFVIMDNQVRVPDANRTVTGAGTYVAVHNIRGTAAATPTATHAAAKGDTWLNDLSSSTTVKEWVCTSAGLGGANTLKVVALA